MVRVTRSLWVLGATCACATASIWACGGTEPVSTPTDAGIDTAKPKPRDASRPDTAPPPYVPIGVKCVRDPNAPLPTAWSPPALDASTGDASEAGEAGIATPTLPLIVSTKRSITPLPVFVPITFDADDLRPQIEDFIASVGCSTWWRNVAYDYGVADGITAAPVHLSEAPPVSISDTEIQSWIKKRISDNTLSEPTPNTIYSIFYTSGTDVTAGFGKGCFSFGAYHSYFLYQGVWVGYAVMPRCGDLVALTQVTSHELIEAVTDPAPGGYQDVGDRNVAWSLLGGSEVGDMCEHTSNANYQPEDYPFPLQRAWSNKSAFLGHDPCLPSDSQHWFVAAPVLTDTVMVNYYGHPIQALGLKLAAGNQATIDLRMISDGSTGGWSLSAQDISQWTLGKTTLKFAFGKTQGVEGELIPLTITRTGTNGNYVANPFFIRSTAGNAEHLWFGVVGD